jgi:hypothetical protein
MASKSGNVAADNTAETVTETDTGAEIVRANNGGASALDKLAMLSSGSGIVSTIQGTDVEARKATLNAVTNAEPIADHLGETINMVHAVFQAVTVADDKTGEVNDTVRTVLLDADGKAYAAISDGLIGSLRDVFGIMGQPSTWPEPLPVKVVEKRGRSGFRFMKIELA